MLWCYLFYLFISMIIMKFQPGQKYRNLMAKLRLATLFLYTIRIQPGKQLVWVVYCKNTHGNWVGLIGADRLRQQTFANLHQYESDCIQMWELFHLLPKSVSEMLTIYLPYSRFGYSNIWPFSPDWWSISCYSEFP